MSIPSCEDFWQVADFNGLIVEKIFETPAGALLRLARDGASNKPIILISAGIHGDEPETFAFSEYHGHGASESTFMVRKGDWKLIYHCNAPHQLIDLAKDPDELENLYDSEPKAASEMEADLRSVCDPDAENRRAHDFVDEQVQTIEKEKLSYAI